MLLRAIAPFLGIDVVLMLAQPPTAANLFERGGDVELVLYPLEKFVEQPAGDVVSFSRIHEAKHEKLRQQHLPIGLHAHKQPFPIQRGPLLAQDMVHIRPIEPVAILEQAVVSGDTLAKLLRDVALTDPVAETFVVSTCNRVEVYADVDRFHAGVTAICELLARHCGVQARDLTALARREDRRGDHQRPGTRTTAGLVGTRDVREPVVLQGPFEGPEAVLGAHHRTRSADHGNRSRSSRG